VTQNHCLTWKNKICRNKKWVVSYFTIQFANMFYWLLKLRTHFHLGCISYHPDIYAMHDAHRVSEQNNAPQRQTRLQILQNSLAKTSSCGLNDPCTKCVENNTSQHFYKTWQFFVAKMCCRTNPLRTSLKLSWYWNLNILDRSKYLCVMGVSFRRRKKIIYYDFIFYFWRQVHKRCL
jgi:hypothetical protein